MNVTATNQKTAGVPQAGDAPARTAPTGKSLPPAGKASPQAQHQPPPISVEKALEQIRSFLNESQRQLNFQLDESSGRTIIKVINPASGEVIRQMPSEEVVKLAAIIEAQGFRTLNELA